MGPQTLKIQILSFDDDTLPKQLQVLDSKLGIVSSIWTQDDYYQYDLEPGFYLVRLLLTTGKKFEEVAELKSGESKVIEIYAYDKKSMNFEKSSTDYIKKTLNKTTLSPVEKWKFSKAEERFDFQIPIISAKLWTLENSIWESIPVPQIIQIPLSVNGQTFIIEIPNGLQLLEIESPNMPSTFVRVPPNDTIKCHIKMSDGPIDNVNELDVSITISDDRIQTLLTLLNSGDTARAKSFITPVEYAEKLLYQKVQNPLAAAIGGYYLLRTEEYDRLHSWAKNLANWFEWLPDGKIIYAWQLIQESKNEQNYDGVKQVLLEALERGIPIFSEGLRLLHDGLSMCSYHSERRDLGIEEALFTIKEYIASADLSCALTTYSGVFPDLMAKKSANRMTAGSQNNSRPLLES
jgi:hypothetical protein